MSRLPDLLTLQVGTNDSDWGTAMAPSAKLMGIQSVTITPVVEVQMLDELRGTFAPAYDAEIAKEYANVAINGLVNYEDICYFLDGLLGQATPTTDASGNGTYDYVAPLNDVSSDYPDPRIMTLVYGEEGDWSSDAVGVPGFTVKNLTISGATGAAQTFSVNGIGKEVAKDEIDTTLADRNVNVAMGDHVALYLGVSSDYAGIDSSDSGLNQLNGGFTYSLALESNRDLVFHLGSTKPSGYRDAKWSGTLDLSLELDTDTVSYLNSIIDPGTPFERTVRIEMVQGDYLIRLDFNGVQQNAPQVFTNQDGVLTVELSLVGKYSATMGNWFKARVISSAESLA